MPISHVSTQMREYEGSQAAYFFRDGLELGDWEGLCMRVSGGIARREGEIVLETWQVWGVVSVQVCMITEYGF